MLFEVKRQRSSNTYQISTDVWEKSGKLTSRVIAEGLTLEETDRLVQSMEDACLDVAEAYGHTESISKSFIALYFHLYGNPHTFAREYQPFVVYSAYYDNPEDAFSDLLNGVDTEELLEELAHYPLAKLSTQVRTIAEYCLQHEDWYALPNGVYLYHQQK